MKKQVKSNQFHGKKLDVNRETIRHLNHSELKSAQGGFSNRTRPGEDDEI